MTTFDKIALALLLLLCTLMFTMNMGGYGLWPADEPRFGEVPREMMQSGNYLAPHINGEPYKEKPPLLFWAIAAVSAPLGDVTEFSARIPSAVSALITLLFTWMLAVRLFGPQVAWWSVLVLATCLRFWWQARTVQIDMMLTACMTASLYAFWRFQEAKDRRWLLLLYAGMAAGILAKGPPALLFPLLLVFSFHRKDRDSRKQAHWFIGSALAIGIALLWLVPARMSVSETTGQSADTAVAADLFRNIIGRAILGISKAQMPWYYLETLLVDWMPWTLFFPWVLPWIWRRRKESKEMRFLWCWTVPALILFSIFVGKRAIYILPLFPVMAILITRALLDIMEQPGARWQRALGFVWGTFLLALAAIPFALRFTEYRDVWGQPLLLFSLCVAAFALDTLHRAIRNRSGHLHVRIASHICGVYFLSALFVLPAIDPYKSAAAFCRPIRSLVEAGQDPSVHSVGFSREEYVFYAKHFHQVWLAETLPIEDGSKRSDTELAMMQYEARKVISRAVRDVPIASFAALSQADLEALRVALEAGVEELGKEDFPFDAFADAIHAEVAALRMALEEAEGAAFVIVQTRDWRWLLALDPELAELPVLVEQDVGNRDVILIGNNNAADA